MAKKTIGILFMAFMLAGMLMCDRSASQKSADPFAPIDTPSNGRRVVPTSDDENDTNVKGAAIKLPSRISRSTDRN